MQDKDVPWDLNNTIVITQRNIFSFIRGLDKIIRAIYECDIFATKNGTIVTYSDEVKKNTVTMTLPFSKNSVMFIPSVVYDENGVSYEGATICLNNTANSTGLSIESLEALRYSICKIDFFTYSQLLVNYYINYYMCSYREPVDTGRTKMYNTKKNNIKWSEPVEPKTVSTFTPIKTDDEFTKLMG